MIVKFENIIKKINYKIFEKRGDFIVLKKILNKKTGENNGNME